MRGTFGGQLANSAKTEVKTAKLKSMPDLNASGISEG